MHALDRICLALSLILAFVIAGAAATAQPAERHQDRYPRPYSIADAYEPPPPFIEKTKGPFGLLHRSYEPPPGAIFIAVDGDPKSDGSTLEQPTTLERAIERATTGDTLVLRGGVYRTGNLEFATQITLQPYLDERPVLRGSKPATNWHRRGDHWVTKWDTMYRTEPPKWYKPRQGPLWIQHRDLVTVDGFMFRPIGSLDDLEPGMFFCDYENGEIYLADDPTGRVVEITHLERGLLRRHHADADPIGPTVRGLTFLHYAHAGFHVSGDPHYRLIEPRESPNGPVGTVVEDCLFALFPRAGLAITSPQARLAHNEFLLMGYEIMFMPMSHDAVLEHNIVARTNYFHHGGYPAGFKVFNQGYGVTSRNNYFTEISCIALWYDVGLREIEILDNYFLRCGSSLKIEISHRAVIAGNIFQNAKAQVHNSAEAEFYNNTFINSQVWLWRNNRGYRGRWNTNFSFNHAATGPGVEGYHGHQLANNVFAGSPPDGIHINIEDRNDHDPTFPAKRIAHNLFTPEAPTPIAAQFTPDHPDRISFPTLSGFAAVHPGVANANTQTGLASQAIFVDPDVGDYRLRPEVATELDAPVSDEVIKLLGLKPGTSGIGAFVGH
ncbi:MAG: hypothetical protein AAGI68_00220 [Planctomycetota bacterium]